MKRYRKLYSTKKYCRKCKGVFRTSNVWDEYCGACISKMKLEKYKQLKKMNLEKKGHGPFE